MLQETILDFLDKFLIRGGKPPKYKMRTWKISDNKKLCVRFDDGYNCREEINDCLNCNVPVITDVNSYAVFEIKKTDKKGKHSSVVARVRYPAFSHFFLKPDPDYIPLEDDPRYELIENLPDGTMTFAKKLTGEPDIDGWVSVNGKITIRSFPAKTPPPPEPGELTVKEEWCYDLFPNATDADNIPGASLLLTCQPVANDGDVSDVPWRIKIRNYTLVRSSTSFKQVDTKEDFVLLSTDQFREIEEFLSSEYEQHMLFNILQTIAATQPNDSDDTPHTEAIF